MKTPPRSARERAEALLELHNGNCMAPQVSEVGKAFLQMEVEGLVKVSLAELQGCICIQSISFDTHAWAKGKLWPAERPLTVDMGRTNQQGTK